jgi:flagellar basal-body rod modification protein FlgD
VTVPATESTDLSQLANSATYGAATTTKSTSDDYDMFLKLLVAQLKYQDPMNPTDSSQFLSQNAQFTSLQKMGELNDTLSSLLSVQSSFGSTNLIGKNIVYANADGTTSSGIATGVTFYTGGPVLTIDGKEVSVSAVITVGDAVPPTTDSSGTSSDTTA